MRKRKATNSATLPQKLLAEARLRGLEELLLRAKLVVGVSGGADSLALLHALCALRGDAAKSALHVAHLEHGFRGAESKADADFVAGIAAAYGLPHTIRSVNVPALAEKRHLSPEDAARRARYTFLAELAQDMDATVAVAHTANDQAETVLMGILRGAGLAGIAGMQSLSELRFVPLAENSEESREPSTLSVSIFRPMLTVWREEVEQYCAAHCLEPRTDSTNTEATYARNRVRLDLLPYLQAHYSPAIKEHLANLANIASSEDSLLEAYARLAWAEVASYDPTTQAVQVNNALFSTLHLAIQRRIVRQAIGKAAGTLDGITFGHINSAVSTMANEPDSAARLHLPHGLAVERDAGYGTIRKRVAHDGRTETVATNSREWPLMQPGMEIPLEYSASVPLEGGWLLTVSVMPVAEIATAPGELEAHFDRSEIGALGALTLRTRRPGDSMQPLGMVGRKRLQDLYVDAKIPRILRDHLPVLAVAGGSDVLWVPGPRGRRSSVASVTPETTHVLTFIFTIV